MELFGTDGVRGEAGSFLSAELAMKVASFFPGISVVIQNQLASSKGSMNYVPDVSKFKEKFSVRQEIDLELAIKKTISHYQKQ